jgi:carbon-monoxide dehydrogenase small subunit
MSQVKLTINGREVSTDVEPRLSLADFLRDHIGLTGTHLGCEHGVCGACTVLLNGEPVRSCISLTVSCENMEVRTIEGFDDDAVMAVLRNAFSEEHGVQCGFCTPGVLISARDIVTRLPNLPRQRLREELSGNLCRCTGYAGILRAIEVAMEELKIGGGAK